MGAAVTPPVFVVIAWAAWVATFVYFLISWLFTRRTVHKEAGRNRLADRALIWGGYFFLFVHFAPHTAWSTAYFIPPAGRVPLGVAGAAVTVLGLALTCWSRAVLGRYWSGIVALKADHKLVRSGPYARIRHPLYTGLLAASLGLAFAVGLWHVVLGAALLWTAFISRAHREDSLLARQFGPDFTAYRRHTGLLLPAPRRA